jgi:hypothetical protein
VVAGGDGLSQMNPAPLATIITTAATIHIRPADTPDRVVLSVTRLGAAAFRWFPISVLSRSSSAESGNADAAT